MTRIVDASEPLILGVDIGTSGIKGVLTSPKMRAWAQTRIPIEVSRPNPGWAEHDPKDWWAGFNAVIRHLTGGDERILSRVSAVGVSGICPVVLPVDHNGRGLRPTILYSIDQRAGAELHELTQRYPNDAPFKRSGQSLGSQNALAKMLWLRANEEQIWRNTHVFLGSTGYVVHKLTGTASVDHFSAADGGLGYDLDRLDWDYEVLADVGVPADLLPPLHWPSDVVGRVHAQAAAETGLLEGTIVVAGTGDALADLIATGAQDVGQGALLYGTSMSTMILSDKRSDSPDVVTVPGWQPNHLVHSAILSIGVGLFEWWVRWCGGDWGSTSLEALDDHISRSTPGSRGILHVPYLAGARQTSMGGALLGLKTDHTPSDRYRAIAEGLGHALRALIAESDSPHELYAIGGGTAANGLVQVISNICGFDQIVLDASTNAALGAARLAAQGSGLASAPDSLDSPPPEIRISAQAQHRSFYNQRQRQFDAAVRALSEITLSESHGTKEDIGV